MKMIDYLYYGMLLIAVVLIYFAMRQYSSSRDLLANGIKTKAKVIDLIEQRDDDGHAYRPVFEYKDRSNKMVTFQSDVSSRPAPYDIGESVDIVYSKDGEYRKVVSFRGLYRWTVILLCIASPLLIIGGGYVWYAMS